MKPTTTELGLMTLGLLMALVAAGL